MKKTPTTETLPQTQAKPNERSVGCRIKIGYAIAFAASALVLDATGYLIYRHGKTASIRVS